LELERAEKEFARVEQLKAAKAISQAEFDAKQYELERAKIQLRRAEAKLFAPAADGSAGTPKRGKLSQQTEVKLLELDLADAKLAVEEAESELQRVDQLRKQSPSAVSEQEIRKYQFQADRAKIQMQRIMVKLEATRADSEPSKR
jgi:multidrug resistance efflux pump